MAKAGAPFAIASAPFVTAFVRRSRAESLLVVSEPEMSCGAECVSAGPRLRYKEK